MTIIEALILSFQTVILLVSLFWIARQASISRRLFGSSFSSMIEERMAALTRVVVEYPELGRLWNSTASAKEQDLREEFYCCMVMDLAELIEAFRRSGAITEKRRADRYRQELIKPIAERPGINAGITRALSKYNFPISKITKALLDGIPACVGEETVANTSE